MSDLNVLETRKKEGTMQDEKQLVVFQIGKEEFGLNIEAVREIVRVPEITKIPRCPDYMLGISNLRGNVIPAIDARKRFDMQTAEKNDKTRMLVVDSEGILNGLVIDSVSEVVRIAKNSIEAAPNITKGIERQFLDGVVKLNDGKRLIMILNNNEIVKLNLDTPKTKKQVSQAETADKTAEKKRVDECQIVTFSIGQEEYAFEIENVKEILRFKEIVSVPDTPDYIKGIITLRNNLLPILDFRQFIKLDSLEDVYKGLIDNLKQGNKEWVDELENTIRNNVKFNKELVADNCPDVKVIAKIDIANREVEKQIRIYKTLHNELHTSGIACIKKSKEDKEQALLLFKDETELILVNIIKSLNKLADLIRTNIFEDQKILVIELGGISAGILVDHVSEVLNLNKDLIDKAPALASSKEKELKGVAKLNNGERLIMILDNSSIFNHENTELISNIKNQNQKDEDAMKTQNKAGLDDEQQLVTFKIESETFGIRIKQVQEINRVSKITKVPKAPFFIEGVVNLRGMVIPVIDLRKRFALQHKEYDDRTRIVITDLSGKKTGLIVDRVNEVTRVQNSKIYDTPDIIASSVDADFIEGIGKVGDDEEMVLIINVDKILSEQEKKEYAKLTPADEPIEKKQASAPKEQDQSAKIMDEKPPKQSRTAETKTKQTNEVLLTEADEVKV